MPVLESPKHEAFAEAVAEGASATAAYREHVADEGTTTGSCMTLASRLLQQVEVALRVAELRKSFEHVLEHKLGVRQETMARYLLSVIETPIGEITINSPLCQEYKRTRKMVGRGEEAEEWEVEQVKKPAALDAVDKLVKMAGWYSTEKLQIEAGDALALVLAKARGQS